MGLCPQKVLLGSIQQICSGLTLPDDYLNAQLAIFSAVAKIDDKTDNHPDKRAQQGCSP